MRRVHVDANVILRFLRDDDASQSPQAAALFQRAQSSEDIELWVSAITLMEVFYVLTRAYEFPRADAAGLLGEFLQTGAVICPDADRALGRITSQKQSFGDAYLVASAAADGGEIATFDRGILGLNDVRSYAF